MPTYQQPHWRRYTLLVILGFLVLGVSSGLAAGPGTLLYAALSGLATVAVLSGVLRAQWRRVTSAVAETDVFESWASARGPQPAEGDLVPAGAGLVRGSVGRLRVDRRGVFWAPRWHKSAPGIAADWDAVADIALVPIKGLGHPTYVEVRLRSGEGRSLGTSSGDALEATLSRFRGPR